MREHMRKQLGFTLIELMIAVAVVGILTAIAYPSYVKYVQKSNRSEGIAQLADGSARMERYYAQNNSYAASSLAAIGISTTTSPTGKYIIKFNGTPTATTYSLEVDPQGNQANDTCGSLFVDQQGLKTSSNTSATDCFK